MSLEQERATAFIDSYRQTWESWNVEGFAELFSDRLSTSTTQSRK
jgi:hypothetical protein